eukprot:3521845-Pyramimonas_sp.AAC.2
MSSAPCSRSLGRRRLEGKEGDKQADNGERRTGTGRGISMRMLAGILGWGGTRRMRRGETPGR